MTKTTHHKNNLILAVAPSSKGFGFAVLEGNQKLVDWGVKSVSGDKNAGTVKHVEKMIALYQPDVFVLHDARAKGSRRHPRIRNLTKKLIAMAARRKVTAALFSRDQVMKAFFIDGKGTKYAIAKFLSMRFPAELGHRLPRKRKDYESEDSRMKIFEAVALAITDRLHKKK